MKVPRVGLIRPIRLRTQLALSMVAAVLLAVAFGYVGLTVWGQWTTKQEVAALSVPARRALGDIQAGHPPDPHDLAVLNGEADALDKRIGQEQDRALILLTLLASMVGVVAGVAFASRLTLPLEVLARTAREVAAGDLSARATPRLQGAGETAQLIEDFNAMAEALERTDRQLKESSAAIAHELRTPLTILRGRLQGLSDGVFTADTREIGSLIRHVESLSRIVDDLRTVSNADAGVLELRPGVVDLAEEADDAARAFAQTFAGAGIRVELDLQTGLARADALRVRQVLLALLENVQRHGASGGELRIETFTTAEAVVLRVLDRGPGFPQGTETFAFRPFWRADDSRSRESGGTGLGLAVIAAIMKAHGGSVMIEGRNGGGAAITLTFPPAV